MDAMTSRSSSRTLAARRDESGDGVQATLVVTDTSAWLEDRRRGRSPTRTRTCRFDETVLLQPGSTVPDFKLVNQ